MSNPPNRVKKTELLDRSTLERRNRQYEELKKWDLGHTTGLQCIESIIELEKIIFIGNNLKKKPETRV
jgi:hypothetical protein